MKPPVDPVRWQPPPVAPLPPFRAAPITLYPVPGGEPEDVVVDARGLACPAPVIALAKVARALPAGSRITVLATDPAAAVDVPAWARMRGHQVLQTSQDGEHLVLTVLLEGAKAR